MKKIILMPVIFLLMLLPVMAVLDADTDLVNITLNFPINNVYNSSGVDNDVYFILNATVNYAPPMNLTNVSFILFVGTNYTRYTNSTINGSRTVAGSLGDWIFNISAQNLSEGSYTVVAEAHNSTEWSNPQTAINSSSITFTIDRTAPVIALERPQNGISLTPQEGNIRFDYRPTEVNLGNCSLYLAGRRAQSSTSGTTSPNVSTGSTNSFTTRFGGNNQSLSWNVECVDLAGLRANATARTINVLAVGFSNIVSPGGAVSSSGGKEYLVVDGKTLAVGNTNQMPAKKDSRFLQQYGGWIALLAVAGLIWLMWKWKPK